MRTQLRSIPVGAVITVALIAPLLSASEPSGDLAMRGPCEEYSWSPTTDALAYELRVIEFGAAAGAAPAIEVAVPASITEWSPAADQCLEPGKRFVWTVRAVTPSGSGEWSPGALFRVSGEADSGEDDEEPPTEESPGTEPAQREAPATDPGPAAGATSGRKPDLSGSMAGERLPGLERRPSFDSRSIGETEKNDPSTSAGEQGAIFDARQKQLADTARQPRDLSQIQAGLRISRRDFELEAVEARGVQREVTLGSEVVFTGRVRVHHAAPEDAIAFFLAIGEPGSSRPTAVSEHFEAAGEGPHTVVLRVAVERPLVVGRRFAADLFLLGERRVPGLPGRTMTLKWPIEDTDPDNHRKSVSYDVLRPQVEIVRAERVGNSGAVEVGDRIEIAVRARLTDGGPARIGVSYAIGDPAKERIDAMGPKVFHQGDGEFGEATVRFRVEPHQIVDGAFRTTLFLLRDSEASAPFAERLFRDGDPSDDRRELVYPVEWRDDVVVRHVGVDRDCTSAAKAASDLWQAFRETAREAGCLSPWKVPLGGPRAIAACFAEGAQLPLKLADKMIGHWNDLAQGGWATLGPRRITPGTLEGQVVPLGQRLFIGSSPAGTGELTIAVRKVNGRAGARITACQTYEYGASVKVLDTEVPPNKEDGYTVFKTLSAGDPSVLTVKIDHKGGPLPYPVFGYELEVEEKPRRVNLPAVEGFADLHLHQMARLAHAGHWFWGDHDGAPREALKPCTGLEHALLTFPGMVMRHGPPDPFTLGHWPQWDDVAHQQVHGTWLHDAHQRGLRLAVVSTVNFEPFCYLLKGIYPQRNTSWGCLDMDNIRRQIEAAQEFDAKHDWYEIALNPWHARQIIAEGKLAVVLSIEASRLFPAGDGDVTKQLADAYQMGVRTLQLAHENDTRFAGAAPHRALFEVLQRLKHPLAAGLSTRGFDVDEQGKNRRGLTKEGQRLVQTMMDYRLPIDLAHLSERAVEDVWALARHNRYYPLYNSHTRFRPVLNNEDRKTQKEFLTDCQQAGYIERSGGMVGLRTGDNALLGVAASGVTNDCPGSSKSFAQLVEFGNRFTRLEMGFGSDLNGFISQVGPRFGEAACAMASDETRSAYAKDQIGTAKSGNHWFDVKGLSHVGLLPDLVADLRAVGADTARLERSAEAFLQMWERAWDDGREDRGARSKCQEWQEFGG